MLEWQCDKNREDLLVEKNLKKYTLPVIAAILTVFALSMTGLYAGSADNPGETFLSLCKKEMTGIGIDKLVVLIAIIALYMKCWRNFCRSCKWITHLIAAMFSVFMLIGMSFSVQGNWSFFTAGRNQILIALLTWAGFFFLFDIVISLLYAYGEKHPFLHSRNIKKFPEFMEKHYLLVAFLLILAGWLPYILIFWPGSVPYDGFRQLNMFAGNQRFTNKHPWELSLIMGALMTIGNVISDNWGIFMVVGVLALIYAVCYATVCYKLKSWGAPRWFNICCIAFFSLVPVFGAYSQTIIKDGIFSALFSLFMAIYVECCIPTLREKSGQSLRQQLTVLFLTGFGMCITRNNGLYMVLPAFILLFFFLGKKRRLYAVGMVILVTVGYMGLQKEVAPRLYIGNFPSRVFFSIPMQQTARYLKEYPDDVTKEEAKAIDGVMEYDEIADLYNPELSDPVKATYRGGHITMAKLKRYFNAWFSMFLRHPGVYIEATLHNSYGYYYPFHNCTAQSSYRFYTVNEPLIEESDYHQIFSAETRNQLKRYADLWSQIPGLAQICNAGTYTWIVILLLGYLIYRKRWKGILVLAAPALNVAICIASPVNGLLRYAFPLMACMPAVIFWGLAYAEKAIDDKGTDEK